MRKEFKTYILSLINDIPHGFYEGVLSILCVGLVVFLVWKGKQAGQYIARLILIEFTVLIYYSTIICRATKVSREYNFTPFWSYEKPELFVENIMNVVVFVPIGLLLGIAFKQMTWWKTLLIGCSISISIESLQFWFMKGFSEVDDVMHNTVGCLIGFLIVSGFRHITAAVNHLHRAPRCFSVLC